MLADPTRRLRFSEIIAPAQARRFHSAIQGDLHLDFGRADYWLRFSLYNSSDRELTPLLKILPAFVRSSTLYQGADDRPLQPLRNAGLLRQPLLYQLTLPAHGSEVFHLQLRDNHQLPVSLRLVSWERMLHDNLAATFSNGLTIGAIAILCIFNLFAAAYTRDSLYLWLGSYCGLVLLATAATWGFLSGENTVTAPLNGSLFAAVVLLCLAASLQFALALGVCREAGSPFGEWLLRAGVATCLVCAPLALALDDARAIMLTWLLVPFAAALLLVCPLLAFFRGHSSLMLAYFLSRVGVVILNLFGQIAFNQGLPNIDAVNAIMLAGTSFEAVALTGLLLVRSSRNLRYLGEKREFIAAVEAENRAHSELINHLGHKLRSPIGGILGMTELLNNTPLSLSQRDYVQTLERSARNVLQQLDEAGSTITRYSGVTQLANSLFDLHTLVASCRHDFAAIAEEMGVQLRCSIEGDLASEFLGYPDRLKQLLVQLLNAAFDSCQHSDISLLLSAESGQSGRIRIELRHGGQPLSAEDITMLTAGSSARNRQHYPHPGINLRLALARQLSDSMNGQLQACNHPEGGASVVCTLPLTAADSLDGSAAPACLAGKHLLVADGDPVFCQLTQRQTQGWGLQVQVAGSEHEALALARNQLLLNTPIDALLVDQGLGDNAGIKLIRRIRREALIHGLEAPVAILLCNGPPPPAATLAEAGVRCCLSRPCSGYALRRTLQQELEQVQASALISNGNATAAQVADSDLTPSES